MNFCPPSPEGTDRDPVLTAAAAGDALEGAGVAEAALAGALAVVVARVAADVALDAGAVGAETATGVGALALGVGGAVPAARRHAPRKLAAVAVACVRKRGRKEGAGGGRGGYWQRRAKRKQRIRAGTETPFFFASCKAKHHGGGGRTLLGAVGIGGALGHAAAGLADALLAVGAGGVGDHAAVGVVLASPAARRGAQVVHAGLAGGPVAVWRDGDGQKGGESGGWVGMLQHKQRWRRGDLSIGILRSQLPPGLTIVGVAVVSALAKRGAGADAADRALCVCAGRGVGG